MCSALRGLFIAWRAISSCSWNNVTSFVYALRGDLSGQAPFDNSYRCLASVSAVSSNVFLQLCFDTLWSVRAHSVDCLLGRTGVPPLVKCGFTALRWYFSSRDITGRTFEVVLNPIWIQRRNSLNRTDKQRRHSLELPMNEIARIATLSAYC